jgi:RNA polymerase sigma-70 factor (ECF subfamily)
MTPTDTSLLRRVQDPADTAAWGEFVELYEPLLLAYVRSRGLTPGDAQDVVQEVLLALLRALPQFTLDPQRGRFRTWLYQVTVNKLKDHTRRLRSRERAEQGWREHSAAVAADGAQPDTDWLSGYRRRVLDFALARVKGQTQPRTWSCFEQHVLHGRTGEELAQELGITANAVRVNANRILDRVRALCAEYLEELKDD